MKILVLNWGVAQEYSWQHSLFAEMALLGADITVVSAKRSWEPRGGKDYPETEEHPGLRYHRIFRDITDFKARLGEDMEKVLKVVGEDFDIVWIFHQANWIHGRKYTERLGAKQVLVCEQAFRTSGYQADGKVTNRWKDIQQSTDLIISWAPIDKENEKKIGVKYLPFGGCYPGIEKLVVNWGEKWKKPYAIYQGTLTGNHKNQDAMYKDIKKILDSAVVDYFVINGYLMDEKSHEIVRRLKVEFNDRFRWELLVGRDKVFKWLRGAVFGYSPMQPYLLSNFPFEAFGCGVPMYMPYVKDRPDFVTGDWKELTNLLIDRRRYQLLVNRARAWYDMNLSTEVMGRQYYQALEGIL